MLRGVGFGWSGVVEEDEGGYEWREPRFELSNAVWRRERQREEEEEEEEEGGDAARRKGKRGR